MTEKEKDKAEEKKLAVSETEQLDQGLVAKAKDDEATVESLGVRLGVPLPCRPSEKNHS